LHRCGEQAIGLAQPRAIERIAHRAGVSEIRLPAAQGEIVRKGAPRVGVEAVVHRREHPLGDVEQFPAVVVGERDVMRDARTKTRIALEEHFHARRVTGENHDQIVTLVFHCLEQDLDRLLTVVAFVFRAIQVIRFVDEKHTAHRAL
jgi:hypothetical protein